MLVPSALRTVRKSSSRSGQALCCMRGTRSQKRSVFMLRTGTRRQRVVDCRRRRHTRYGFAVQRSTCTAARLALGPRNARPSREGAADGKSATGTCTRGRASPARIKLRVRAALYGQFSVSPAYKGQSKGRGETEASCWAGGQAGPVGQVSR